MARFLRELRRTMDIKLARVFGKDPGARRQLQEQIDTHRHALLGAFPERRGRGHMHRRCVALTHHRTTPSRRMCAGRLFLYTSLHAQRRVDGDNLPDDFADRLVEQVRSAECTLCLPALGAYARSVSLLQLFPVAKTNNKHAGEKYFVRAAARLCARPAATPAC